MNDPSDKPLKPAGDEALEARITAWVLGEASPFEAAELEKLCAADPALRSFERRMRDLCGLLEEDAKAGPDAEWRLSEGKREKIAELFGASPVATVVPAERTNRYFARRALLAAAACLMISLMAYPLFAPAGRKASEPAHAAERTVDFMPSADAAGGGEIAADIPRKAPDSKYSTLWSTSPMTTKPPATAMPQLAEAEKRQETARGLGGAGPAAGKPTDLGLAVLDSESMPADAASAPAAEEGGEIAGVYRLGGTLQKKAIPESAAESALDSRAFFGREMDVELATRFREAPGDMPEPAAAPAASADFSDLRQMGELADRVEGQQGVSKAEEAAELGAIRGGAERDLSFLQKGEGEVPAAAAEAELPEIRRKLYLAEGHYNLGKFDEASLAYKDVLRTDPYNEAARRGVERTELAKQDYDRAAYDQTRSELLAQVDEDWGLNVPPLDTEAKDQPTRPAKPGFEEGRYSGLAQKEMIRRSSVVAQSDDLRDKAKKLQGEGNPAEAYFKYTEAMGALPDVPMVKDRRDHLAKQLGESAAAAARESRAAGREAEAREWAGRALQWNPKDEVSKEILDLKPAEETSAAAEPFSTFSLHVSDASFKLAKAALERGEQPDPAGIRPEEFYNAFDYGDPAPGRGEPVACAIEQAAHPVLPQRNLLRIGIRTGAEGRGAATPLHLTLLLDSSGSMEREDRQAGMAMAVQQLAGLLKEGDSVSVIGFSRQPRLLVERLPGARAKELNAIIAQTPSEGGTNLEEGLRIAEELAKRQFNPAAQNRVVLFTDGAANLGDAEPETLEARVEGMRQQGIAFDAAGFGAEGLNDKLLERLTRNGNGRYYIVDRPEDADANFAKQLAGAFRPAAENVKVQVRFNPARVGGYKLIGFEEHRLEKEDFRNDAVDAAEMAAEEAGIALYQAEVLPGGEGEIGEVSVRFRDAGSGQMVERTWTIPYEAQAPAFDQAAPSIQLAGLAALTAEKLRKGPPADAIDFQQLGPVLGKVKARYPNSQTVSDLDAMIGKLR